MSCGSLCFLRNWPISSMLLNLYVELFIVFSYHYYDFYGFLTGK